MEKAKIAVLGGSRGLGAAISEKLMNHEHAVSVFSRKSPSHSAEWRSFDFSQKEKWSDLVSELKVFAPEIVFYCAGGGPYGKFGEKDWKSQEWAMKVTFECPAFLIWAWSRGDMLPSLRKFIVIGSAVAESKPDPQAAMYCAAKHALKGLVETIQLESPELDLTLFSAPYMDTQMLPPGCWPRQQDGLVRPPQEVADKLLNQLGL